MQSNYKLRYLPVFYEDLNSCVLYIARKLKNPAAANRLVDFVEKAILHQNVLAEGHVDHIVQLYRDRKDVIKNPILQSMRK